MQRLTVPMLIAATMCLLLPACSDDDPAEPEVQVPTRLELVSGDGQIGVVANRCSEPLVVRVTTQGGLPAPNVQVYFGVDEGAGVVIADTLVVTDAAGTGLTWVTFGPQAGPVRVRATAPGLQGSPVVFALEALAADAVVLEAVSGGDQAATVGETLAEPLVVRLRDGYGNVVGGDQVEFTAGTGSGSVSPAAAASDTLGLVRTSWTLGTVAGIQTMQARLAEQGYPSILFVAQARPAEPDSLALIDGDGVGGTVGAQVPIVVGVYDRYGNPAPGATVNFSLDEGTGSVAPTAVETDAAGKAATTLTLGAAGVHRVTAACPGTAPVTATARSYEPLLMAEPAVTLAGIHLLWSMNGNPGFASYQLYRSDDPDVDRNDLLLATFADENTTDYLDTTVVSGQRYSYRLYVNFDNGFSLPGDVVTAVAGVRVELPGVGFQMEHDTGRNRVWVSIPTRNSVVAFSASNFRVLQEIVVGSQPYGIDLSDDGTTLYCALNGAGAIAVLDITSGVVTEIDIGTELGDPRTWDVLEYRSGELLATSNPGSSGFAYVVRVDRNNGDAASRVAGNTIILAAPILVPDPGGQFVYVGAGFSPNSLYKLDMDQPGGPIVLEDDHGSVSGTSAMAVNGAGDRIYLRSGRVLRTASFNQAGEIGAGVPVISTDDAFCYVGTANFTGEQSLQVWDTTTFLLVNETPIPDATDAMLLLDAETIVILADDLVHGMRVPR